MTDFKRKTLAAGGVDMMERAIHAMRTAAILMDLDPDCDACAICPAQHIRSKQQDGTEILNPVCYGGCPMYWGHQEDSEDDEPLPDN